MSDAMMTAGRHRQLVDEYLPLLEDTRDPGSRQRAAELEAEYKAGLPVVPIARCPYTSAVQSLTMDVFDTDGPWWNYENSVRDWVPYNETCFSIVGALHLNAAPSWTPFVVLPGPEVPFVVPSLLERPEAVAVINHVRVGEHDGYAVAYFDSAPPPPEIPRLNEWGSNRFWYTGADGRWGWDHSFEDQERVDFELGPWLDTGKLQWIAPGDETLTLQRGNEDFPYTGIEGRRAYVRMQYGLVWDGRMRPEDLATIQAYWQRQSAGGRA